MTCASEWAAALVHVASAPQSVALVVWLVSLGGFLLLEKWSLKRRAAGK